MTAGWPGTCITRMVIRTPNMGWTYWMSMQRVKTYLLKGARTRCFFGTGWNVTQLVLVSLLITCIPRSRLTNWVGILSQGLRIAPPEAPVTGYMFGLSKFTAEHSTSFSGHYLSWSFFFYIDLAKPFLFVVVGACWPTCVFPGKGVYFADMVSKSANYCFSTRTKNVGLLLLCEVALENQFETLSADCMLPRTLPKVRDGTGSCFFCTPRKLALTLTNVIYRFIFFF